MAEQIELYVTGSVNILKAVAADLQQTGLQRWQKDRILKNFVLQFSEFKELTLLDDNGQPIVSSRLGTPTVTVPGSEGVNIERGAHIPLLGRRRLCCRRRSSPFASWTERAGGWSAA